ncbi:unnamed protein product [Rhizophagus irregularis]|nr:unnamed protein product [Rhizophagus irregularis]CAB4443589.1 unnamed protein product [Rhizophagus irregularis]
MKIPSHSMIGLPVLSCITHLGKSVTGDLSILLTIFSTANLVSSSNATSSTCVHIEPFFTAIRYEALIRPLASTLFNSSNLSNGIPSLS